MWPEPVQRVADFLRAAQAEARLEEFDHETETADDAARSAGAELSQIVKSLVCPRELVERRTGFEPGAVAPFPLPEGTEVFLDQTLLTQEHVWIGAGSTKHLARVRPAELARLSKARQMDAVRDATYHSS